MLDHRIPASADQTLVDRCERDTLNEGLMAVKALDEMSGSGVPDTDYAIPATTGYDMPIMRNGNA